MPSICKENLTLDSIIRIKSEERFSTRHYLLQESPINEGSSEVYYRNNSVTVPFQWESQPGTPKVRSRESFVPVITPPPSRNSKSIIEKPVKKRRKSISLPSVFIPKKTLIQKSSYYTSSSSSLSSRSVSSSPSDGPNESKRYRFERSRTSFDSRYDSNEKNGKSHGCFSSMIKMFVRETA